jgi:pyruvate,orthophosphate dikinase
MEQKFPEAFAEFTKVCSILENHYRDMQDMEFTVEHGKLYMLQTRNGKREMLRLLFRSHATLLTRV